ncbi:rod shape-determining protein MreD [Bacillus salitolerans]|uniref:Rod shape-determining protein MreD n=1 Tax=Bacillus salitolerans TaxID=1437434 RepID=A0ABW4LLH6_9BACI
MRKWIFPILALLCFVGESIFVQVLPSEMYELERIIVPRFVMVMIVIITMYSNLQLGMSYGIVLGLLYDLMYTNLIGVYMFAYPLLAYFITLTMKILHINILTVTVCSLFSITLLEFFVYGVQLLIKGTNLEVVDFLNIRLLPTLVLNLAFVILFYIPLRKRFNLLLVAQKDD